MSIFDIVQPLNKVLKACDLDILDAVNIEQKQKETRIKRFRLGNDISFSDRGTFWRL